MPTATKPLKPIPEQDIEWTDKDGKLRPDIYDYIKKLDALVRALRLEIP